MKYKVSTDNPRATLHSYNVAACARAFGVEDYGMEFRQGVAALAIALDANPDSERTLTREEVANATAALLSVAVSAHFAGGIVALAASQGVQVTTA